MNMKTRVWISNSLVKDEAWPPAAVMRTLGMEGGGRRILRIMGQPVSLVETEISGFSEKPYLKTQGKGVMKKAT